MNFMHSNYSIAFKKAVDIRKILTLLLMVSIFPLHAATYSETTKISVSANNESLESVFHKIEAKSEFLFLYNINEINPNTKITLNISNKSIYDVLKEISKFVSFNYVVKDRHVILTKKEGKESENISISGKVTDESGEPLIGVSILLKNTQIGTLSEIDGSYTIVIPAGTGKPVIVYSYVGYKTAEVSAGGRTIVNVALEEDNKVLGEVVVIGYGTQKKESITSAITAITSTDIERSAATTTSGALVGKVAGLNTRMPDGRPGQWTNISIRNMGTPLYVIDGVQKDEGSFNNIDFNDIESISVLKDASASIYGVQSANGVIVVKTKSGKRNAKNVINVNSYYGTQHMFKFPKPADATTYVRSMIQSNTIKGDTPKYSAEDLALWEQGTEKGYQSFDWYDYILQSAPQWYISANTSGGSEKINYYLGISHLSQDAAIRNHGGFKRYNMQANIDANITDKLKVGLSMNGRIDEKVHPGLPGDDDTWRALFAIYRNLPTIRPYANDNPNYPAKTSSGGDTNFAIFNTDQSGKYQDKWRVIQTNFNAEYEIIPKLTVKGIFGYFFAHQWMDNQEYSYKLYRYDEVTDTYPIEVDYVGKYRERQIQNIEELMGQVSVNYETNINGHDLKLMGGAESYRKDTPKSYLNYNPVSDAISLISAGNQLKNYNDEGNNTQARLGYVGRINYNYKQKYFLELAARYDGSWKFPKGDRWGFFPSVSAGWRISEEEFWQNSAVSSVITDLKPRISYGLLGDDNVEDYSAFGYLDGYNYYKNGSVMDGEYIIGASPRPTSVKSLSWLKAKIFDVGIDFSLFGGRLQGAVDYFQRTRTGLPAARYDILIPTESGFEYPLENLNSDVNRGVDGSLVWRDKIGDFTYSAGGNITFARQFTWDRYKERFGSGWNEYRGSANHRYANINWGLVSDGQFQSWEEIAAHPIDIDGQGNKTMRPGDIKYVDQNGDGIINDLDQRPIGYQQGGLPYLNFGLNFQFGYKGIDLSFDFTGSTFNSYAVNYESRFPFHGDGNNPQYYLENQWRLSDIFDKDSELIPGKYPTVLEGNAAHPNYLHSDFWVYNVSYIKLRNLELGYTFPQNIVSKLKMQKIRFYVLMQNLFCIDNLGDIDIDPEITTDSGINYPTNRVINFGVNLTF